MQSSVQVWRGGASRIDCRAALPDHVNW